MTWEERMAAKHQRQPTEIPWREPTWRERIWQPNIGRWWAPWFRWRLPRLLCTRCYGWRRDGPNRLTWFRVCGDGREVCEHRHHKLDVCLAYSASPDWVYGGTYRIHGTDMGDTIDTGWVPWDQLP